MPIILATIALVSVSLFLGYGFAMMRILKTIRDSKYLYQSGDRFLVDLLNTTRPPFHRKKEYEEFEN